MESLEIALAGHSLNQEEGACVSAAWLLLYSSLTNKDGENRLES